MLFHDGLHVVVKQDCPTCEMIEPAIRELAAAGPVSTYVQDNSDFLSNLDGRVDDAALAHSFHLGVEAVPTLLLYRNGKEIGRAIGWNRAEWQELSGAGDIGSGLPEQRPGCGSLSVQSGVAEVLKAKFGDTGISSRTIEALQYEDEHEICYDRGWSDGFPVKLFEADALSAMILHQFIDLNSFYEQLGWFTSSPASQRRTVQWRSVYAAMASNSRPENTAPTSPSMLTSIQSIY